MACGPGDDEGRARSAEIDERVVWTSPDADIGDVAGSVVSVAVDPRVGWDRGGCGRELGTG